MQHWLWFLAAIGLWTTSNVLAQEWTVERPYRAVFRIEGHLDATANRIVTAKVDLAAMAEKLGLKRPLDHNSLRVEGIGGGSAGGSLPFRFDHRFNPRDQSYRSAGDLSCLVPNVRTTQIAVYFAGKLNDPADMDALPPIGDGDLLRLAGDGLTSLPATACYPNVVDFDGDGLWDLVGSDRYGTGARVTWFRNIGTRTMPLFSQREIFRLETKDGKPISNPNRGWMLTTALIDWDGDARRDLLVGGWCRYLTFYKNVGRDTQPAFDAGKVIFDAKNFPGLDYGKNPDTPYQGVFIEPCDWDNDGRTDLLCGTYMRAHVYFLRNTGRDADGLPKLAPPVALIAADKPIDFLGHGKPSVGDWDGDGDLDLMSGQYYTEASPGCDHVAGSYYFENVGDRRNPKLAAGVQVRDVDGRLVSAGFHSEPTMLDWNQDGKMDVLVTGMQEARLFVNEGTAQTPKLTPVPIPCIGQAACRVSNFAYPLAFDLDRDGRLDLVVGDGDGYVTFFKGLERLQFAPARRIKSEGKEIHEVGCPDGGESHCGYVKVAIADWNDDHRPDLVMWSNNGMAGWQRGRLDQDGWCLKFFPGTADPFDFGPPQEIRAAGEHIRAGYRCKPDVADLDGDGLLDLVVACGSGAVNDQCTMMYCRNIGTKKEWKLSAPVPLFVSEGQPLAVSVRTAARLADWDGDGDLDLFTGNPASLGVRYWENLGSKTKPIFTTAKPMKSVNEACESHHEVGVDAVDLDDDGSLDLIVGNGDSGSLHFFRRSFLQAPNTAKLVTVESKTEADGGQE